METRTKKRAKTPKMTNPTDLFDGVECPGYFCTTKGCQGFYEIRWKVCGFCGSSNMEPLAPIPAMRRAVVKWLRDEAERRAIRHADKTILFNVAFQLQELADQLERGGHDNRTVREVQQGEHDRKAKKKRYSFSEWKRFIASNLRFGKLSDLVGRKSELDLEKIEKENPGLLSRSLHYQRIIDKSMERMRGRKTMPKKDLKEITSKMQSKMKKIIRRSIRRKPRFGIEDFAVGNRKEFDLPSGRRIVEDPYIDLLINFNRLGIQKKYVRRIEKFGLPNANKGRVLQLGQAAPVQLPGLIIRAHWVFVPRFLAVRRLYHYLLGRIRTPRNKTVNQKPRKP